MSRSGKILLAIGLCLFYIPGYFFLFRQIGRENYDLPGVILGGFFTLFGLFGHIVILFEGWWTKIEGNKAIMRKTKYFFKILGTAIILPFGVFMIDAGLFTKPDNYSYKDIAFIKGTLRERPEFRKGSKSSTYLYIYLNEYDLSFEPTYERYVHYATAFEDDSSIGDTVTLGISRDDFEKFIKRTKERTYFERHINVGYISVYYIAMKGILYYSPEIHNLEDKDDKKFAFLGVIGGLIMLSACISIWNTDIVRILQANNYDKAAGFLIRMRQRKIM